MNYQDQNQQLSGEEQVPQYQVLENGQQVVYSQQYDGNYVEGQVAGDQNYVQNDTVYQTTEGVQQEQVSPFVNVQNIEQIQNVEQVQNVENNNSVFAKPNLKPMFPIGGQRSNQVETSGEKNINLEYPQNWNAYQDIKGKILSVAVLNKASDIYVASGFEAGVKVHGKIFGLSDLGVLDDDKVNDFLNSLFSEKQKVEFKENLELDFAYSWKDLDGSEKRFRINAFHQSKRPSSTLRYLVNENNTLDSLGLPDILKTLSERNSGIVLVCGVTGSGKSTTIAAMIDHINTNFAKHIISIEDPVEYTFEKKKSWIEQREVGTDTVSFQRAMKSALRQNPNVLFLGEMRDLESIAAAISIAQSGHLVLSTIHARNSVQCINKIIDGFPPAQQNQIRIQLSESICAILTQKLIPSKKGKGQELAMEIMVNTSAIANLIRESQTHQIESIMQISSKEGMKLLDNDILRLIKEDKISSKDAIKYSNDPTRMEKILKEMNLV